MIQEFIQFRDILQLYHWNTKNYSRHVASGNLYDKINKSMDELIETLQMNGKRIKVNTSHIVIKNCSDYEIVSVLENFMVFLENMDTKRSEILNIRDEMLQDISQTLYLFTMN